MPDPSIDASDAPVRPTLGDLFARLVAQGEAFVRAEARLYRVQATRKALSAGAIVGLLGGALVLGQALTVALLIGIMLVIAPSVGLGWAVVIVCGATLATITILVAVGLSRVSKLLKPDEDR